MSDNVKILVVDDDPSVLALTSAVLASGGYDVIEASTGKDALEAVARAHPDLVVLDVVLPDMSGFEVCKQIKADPDARRTFVALQSGLSTSSQAQTTGLDIGADGYIVKGIPNNELLARVNSLVRIKKAEDALQRAHDELDQRVKARTAELLAANQRLIASEKALLERLRFETLLAEISARFIGLPTDRIDNEIEDVQRRMCEVLGLDRSVLWQSSAIDSGMALSLTHRHEASGMTIPTGLNGRDFFPWAVQKVFSGETIAVSRMDDLPPEAARDRDTWRQYGTKSTLVLPLLAGGGTILGALSFAQVREERNWPETVISCLQLIAQVFADTLSRKRADEALRKSEERLSLAADSAEIGLWSVDIATGYLWNSPSSFRLLGLDPGIDLTEELFFSLVHPDDRERLRKKMTEVVLSGTEDRVEYRIIRPDGTLRWLITRAHAYYTSSGKPDRLTGVSLDITDRKQMEQQIWTSAEEWQHTFDSVQDQIMILDGDFRVVRVNASALSFLGLPLERILGKHCFTLIHGTSNPLAACPLARMMETKRQEETEWYDEKTQSWFNVSVAPIFDDHGQITRVVHMIRDVTQHKKAEAEAFNARRELLRTERLLRMGELTASLAHELNQPLTSILSNSRAALRFLEAGRLETNQLREILEDIARDDKRAGDIIRSLRSMVKPEEGEQEPISINDVLNEASSLFHSEAVIRNIRIETDCANPLPPANINKIQILQVLINLMMNAAESMLDGPEGRKIVLRTRAIDGRAVQVAVRDFGPGVEEEDLSKLFEPFFTTKRSGLGMGLSLSRSIIEAHGGHIWVENNPDRGATFYFDLPAGRG